MLRATAYRMGSSKAQTGGGWVMNWRACQAVSRTDGSMGDKPRSGLKRWGRHKPRLGLRRQLESSLAGFITLKGDLIRSQLLNICAC